MHSPVIYTSPFTSTWLEHFFNDFKVNTKTDFRPVIDISEDKDSYILTAELPGVSKENIKIEVKDNQLTLSGKKEKCIDGGNGNYQYTESSCGSFSRSFQLPKNVTSDSISAKHDNGVLTLIIPKPKQDTAKTISIK